HGDGVLLRWDDRRVRRNGAIIPGKVIEQDQEMAHLLVERRVKAVRQERCGASGGDRLIEEGLAPVHPDPLGRFLRNNTKGLAIRQMNGNVSDAATEEPTGEAG